jgi:hypothetical protein
MPGGVSQSMEKLFNGHEHPVRRDDRRIPSKVGILTSLSGYF